MISGEQKCGNAVFCDGHTTFNYFILFQTAVPFGIVVSPLARTLDEEYSPPIVNMGEIGPVRCNRCKAYMCPYMQFIDGGRRFHCLFCKATTEGEAFV